MPNSKLQCESLNTAARFAATLKVAYYLIHKPAETNLLLNARAHFSHNPFLGSSRDLRDREKHSKVQMEKN